MRNKYLIYENYPGPNALGSENIQNKLLMLAVNNSCFVNKGFPRGAFKDLKTGKEVMYKNSNNQKLVDEKRNYIFILPNDDGISFTVEYRDRPDESGKVMKTKTGIRCSTIRKTTDPVASPDQEQIIQFLRNQNFKLYSEVPPSQWQDYSLVDIYTDPDVITLMKDKPYLYQQIESNKNRVFWMWKGSTSVSGLRGSFDDKSKKGQGFVDMLIKKGWKKETDVTAEERPNLIPIDLSKPEDYPNELSDYTDYAKYFQGRYIMFKPKPTIGSGEAIDQKIENFRQEYTIESCRDEVQKYGDLYLNVRQKYRKQGIVENPNEEEKVIKGNVISCLSNWGLKNFKRSLGNNVYSQFEARYIDPITSSEPFQLGEWLIGDKENFATAQSYVPPKGKLKRFFGGVKPVNEDRLLKNVITENLSRVKSSKKKFITEQKIVKHRLEILVENRDLRKKRDLERFFNDFLFETAYLNSKGYNQKVINEQFFDILKGFFSGTGLDAIFQHFKEYAATWILEKFGVDSNSWIGAIITTGLGNLPLGDIGKLTDCNYLVPFLAKTIGESAVKKFIASKGVDNALTSIVRNALVEMLEDTSFGQALEHGLEKLICPLLGDLSGKMSKVTNLLTDKAKENTPSQLPAPSA